MLLEAREFALKRVLVSLSANSSVLHTQLRYARARSIHYNNRIAMRDCSIVT